MKQTKMCDVSRKGPNASRTSVPENQFMETFPGDFAVHHDDGNVAFDLSVLSEEESERKEKHYGEVKDGIDSGTEDDLRNLDGMVNLRISDILPTGMTPLDNSLNCVVDNDELLVEESSVVSTKYGSSQTFEDFGMLFFFVDFLLPWTGFVNCDQWPWERLGHRTIERMGNTQEKVYKPVLYRMSYRFIRKSFCNYILKN